MYTEAYRILRDLIDDSTTSVQDASRCREPMRYAVTSMDADALADVAAGRLSDMAREQAVAEVEGLLADAPKNQHKGLAAAVKALREME